MTGGGSVQFFFGIGSRYSYLAATQLPKLAAETGARFLWRPLHSRELIARAGPDPFRAELARGQYGPAYRSRDAKRWARYYGVAYVEPVWEGVDWKALAMACIAADRLGAGEAFATAMFARCFARGLPPRDEEDLLAVAASVGLSPSSLREEAQSDGVAEAHRQTLADALAVGAFGVPSFLTDDGALFWGQDRLVLLRAHLLAGR
jgi:2-hydroxychromene-2-carboxylate isomerase